MRQKSIWGVSFSVETAGGIGKESGECELQGDFGKCIGAGREAWGEDEKRELKK